MGDRLIDSVALATWLERMDDERLAAAYNDFRLAAAGCQVRVGRGCFNDGTAVVDGVTFAQFSNEARVIPLEIARIIRRHLDVGVPLRDELRHLSNLVEEAFARGDEIDRLEELWRYDASDLNDKELNDHNK